MRIAAAFLSIFLPWPLRRRVLAWVSGADLHRDARIGFSLVLTGSLVMGNAARIGHLNVIWHLDRLELDEEARIGNFNWISSSRIHDDAAFEDNLDRRPELSLGRCAGITQRHYIDCTDAIRLDEFALVAGVRSTFLGHHVNVHRGRQGCAPIHIGSYSMVSTNCVLLGGAKLPAHSILGAKSLLLEDAGDPYRLYVGSPARPVKEYPEDLAWFHRTRGRTF